MGKKKALLLVFAIIAILIASITLYQYGWRMVSESSMDQEYLLVKSANLNHEGSQLVLYLGIANVGEVPVKVKGVYLYYEVPDFDHYAGASFFVGVPEYRVGNPLIVLYGSNPIPPKQEATFKAKLEVFSNYLDECRRLKPGTYIIRVFTEKGTDAFYTIKVSGVKVRTSLQSCLYRHDEFIVNLKVENMGDMPLVLPSNDLKVYVDGKPWKAFYGKEYVVAPGEEELIEAIIPLTLVPYSTVTGRSYPYVDLEKQTVVTLTPNPEFTDSMLREHVIVIDVLGAQLEMRIPPIDISCKVLGIGKTMERDARGQSWWRITSITMEVTSQWISQLDLGWFNSITICVDDLCESFTVYGMTFTQKSPQTYVITIYPSMALCPVSGEKILHVHYGELKVTSVGL